MKIVGPMAEEGAKKLGKMDILVIIGVIVVIAALLLPVVASARKSAKKKDCTNHMKFISVAIMIYEDRYNAMPQGTSGAFYENLRRLAPDSVQDSSFVCAVTGTMPGPGVCEFRGPAIPLTRDLPLNTAIGSDFPDNHGKNEDINVAFFDGHVDIGPYNSAIWSQADRETR